MVSSSLPLRRYRFIDACDRLLVVGTTLATYSAFRSAPLLFNPCFLPRLPKPDDKPRKLTLMVIMSDCCGTRSINRSPPCFSILAQHAPTQFPASKKSTIPLDRCYAMSQDSSCTLDSSPVPLLLNSQSLHAMVLKLKYLIYIQYPPLHLPTLFLFRRLLNQHSSCEVTNI